MFCLCLLVLYLRNHRQTLCPKDFSPTFSSTSFIALALKLGSSVRFALVLHLEDRSEAIRPCVATQLSQPHSLERPLARGVAGTSLVGTNDRRREHLSWAFGSASAFMLMPGPYRFDYCSFVEGFEIEKCETSKFVFLLVVSPWNSI